MGFVAGMVAFVVVAVLVVGIALPGVSDGVVNGFQAVIHNPQLTQAVGSAHAWLSSSISGARAGH